MTLEIATVTDLLDELGRRFEDFIFSGCQDTSDETESVVICYRGSLTKAIGLSERTKIYLLNKSILSIREGGQ